MEKQKFNTEVHSHNPTELYYLRGIDVNGRINVEKVLNKESKRMPNALKSSRIGDYEHDY
jgi:hypothetical protein